MDRLGYLIDKCLFMQINSPRIQRIRFLSKTIIGKVLNYFVKLLVLKKQNKNKMPKTFT